MHPLNTMKKRPFLIVILFFIKASVFSQDFSVHFKHSTITPQENVSAFTWNQFAAMNKPLNGKIFAFIQFKQIPSPQEVEILKANGVYLSAYVPSFTYTAVFTKPITKQILQQTRVRSIFPQTNILKSSLAVRQQLFPSWSIKQTGTVDMTISINPHVTITEVKELFSKKAISIVDESFSKYQILTVRIPQNTLAELLQIPFVEYAEPIAPEPKDLNIEMRNNAKANMLQAPISAGGEGLTGEGVTIGVGDNGDPTSHIDLTGRIINRSAGLYRGHATHVSGIIAGAGLLEEALIGMAPAASIVSSLHYGILQNAAMYVAEYNMVATNNSWGYYVGDCAYAGTYDSYSRIIDQQAFELPKLLHVFAIGNDGSLNCSPYPAGFATAIAATQSAKNDITVGWGDKDLKISPSGSSGPTKDGRLKPEITATGSDVRSTYPNNNYSNDWGSSMASPNVAGACALLVEKYKQLNAGTNPKSNLLKAILMNGANDFDKPGPDYKTGYGWLHLPRSLDMIKNNRYLFANISQASTNTHTINIPANTAQLKVMVYWHDPAAAVFASSTLINDIDLEVETQSSSTVLPWKLDPTPANVYNNAIKAADHTNNHEQVTIDNPATGNYTIKLKGTAINVGPAQEYVIVYDFVPKGLFLTFPKTGYEPLIPGEMVVINWDAWGLPSNNFTLQYSTNNGITWTDIDNNIPFDKRRYEWAVPATATAEAKIRITQNGTSNTDISNAFTILAQPNLSVSATQCEGYMNIEWTAVGGATDYEIMMLQGSKMVSVATTTTTNYSWSGLNKDSAYLISVRARINGKAGRRALAVQHTPNYGTCSGTISDGDLKLDSIVSPNNGRKFTSTEITSNNLVVRIKNLDDAPVNNFDIKYSINGSAFVTQNIAVTIPAGGSYTHTFTGVNFSAAGNYSIIAVVKNTATDVVTKNDTAYRTIKHLPNNPISLDYFENFENASAFEITTKQTGLPGLDNWDFENSTSFGRVRNYVNTGMALNGTKAMTLDADRYIVSGNSNFLTATLNLSNYSGIFSDELGLSMEFWYKHHGQRPHPDNRVWARKNDTSPWVQIFNFDSAQGDAGIWKRSGTINLSTIPEIANGISSSFQIRFGQNGIIQTGDNTHNRGISIDSFKLFAANQDFEIVRIDTPTVNSCGMSNTVPLRVLVKTNRSIPATIPIKFRLNGGGIITENSFLSNGVYQFTNTLNLSAPGTHTLDVWIDHPGDLNRSNDSITNFKIINQPVINSFPYFEDFENGAGNWYTEGKNNTWQLGTPASLTIKKPASGSKAWKTNLAGQYKDNEKSYLYSPCFNTSLMTNPYLSFSMSIDIEQCVNGYCDGAWVEYSTDGKTWNKLGAYGQGTNWYNNAADNLWDSSSFNRWHTASIPLPAAASQLQLRFVMESDEASVEEGIAIDDIHIYDLTYPIYTNATSTPINVTVNGNSWQHFTSGGNIIASINANNNNLGTTAVQSFINLGGIGSVRSINSQYYHDRNITIKPTNRNLSDSATVRFYFTDAETDTLARATSCNTCSKPADAYELGITKYNDPVITNENGSLTDNNGGLYTFLIPANVKKVPYDKGYYAEFKVKDFSEFWLNNGGINNNQPLPLQLIHFSATKNNKDVLVKWQTANEQQVDKFEVEVCRNNKEFNQLQFSKIATVFANNLPQNNYSFIDAELNKTGTRYYRLKMIDKNGSFQYSDIKTVQFLTKNDWQVYPNPVKDVITVLTQAAEGTVVEAVLLNNVGQQMLTQKWNASGNMDKVIININKLKLAAGLYLLKLSSSTETSILKLVKQ